MNYKVKVKLFGNILTHEYHVRGYFISEGYEITDRKELWCGELPFSFLKEGDEFYIEEIDTVVNITKRIKSSNSEIIYHTDYVIDRIDENNEERLLEAKRIREMRFLEEERMWTPKTPNPPKLPNWIKKLLRIE